MKSKFNFKSLMIKLLIIVIVAYVIFTLFEQQKKLDSYESNIAYLSNEIEDKSEYNSELIARKDNMNSLEYIEKIAREKLNMYMPNETVYVDIGK